MHFIKLYWLKYNVWNSLCTQYLYYMKSSNAFITRFPLPRTRIKYFHSQSFNSSSLRSLMQSSFQIQTYFILDRSNYVWRLNSALETNNLSNISDICSFVTKSSSRFFLAFKWYFHSGQPPLTIVTTEIAF